MRVRAAGAATQIAGTAPFLRVGAVKSGQRVAHPPAWGNPFEMNMGTSAAASVADLGDDLTLSYHFAGFDQYAPVVRIQSGGAVGMADEYEVAVPPQGVADVGRHALGNRTYWGTGGRGDIDGTMVPPRPRAVASDKTPTLYRPQQARGQL